MGEKLIEQAGLGIAGCDCCPTSSSAKQGISGRQVEPSLLRFGRVASLAMLFEERLYMPAIELTGHFFGRLRLRLCDCHVRTRQQTGHVPDGQKTKRKWEAFCEDSSSRSYRNALLFPVQIWSRINEAARPIKDLIPNYNPAARWSKGFSRTSTMMDTIFEASLGKKRTFEPASTLQTLVI